MKKILTVVTLVVLSLSSVQAQNNEKMNSQNNGKANKGYGLKHANPMPNLMRITMANKDALKLEKQQIEALQAWSNDKKPQIKKLVNKLMNQEHRLLEESLTTDKNTLVIAQKTLDTRREIMEIKNACRQNLKTILTPEQYEKVVSIYRTKMASK